MEGLEPVRLRPGMYIGGVDKRALHHLAAEIIDNSMDEVVAGHASKIEVRLHDDYSLTISDNGRGIPVDPHPRFPNKSALEVILCTLHAGGKFSDNNYKTSGGLHGVGISVVNALSISMEVSVVRNGQTYVQTFSRGKPTSELTAETASQKITGTKVTFSPDPDIFKKNSYFDPNILRSLSQSKAFLFSGVEITWICPKNVAKDNEILSKETFFFPKGLNDYLKMELGNSNTFFSSAFADKVNFS